MPVLNELLLLRQRSSPFVWMLVVRQYRFQYLSTTHLHTTKHCPGPNQSSEPILIPKLRIDLADFPYLHYSSDQRLLTLETWCGYRYGLERKSTLFSLRFSRDNESALALTSDLWEFSTDSSTSQAKPSSVDVLLLQRKDNSSPGSRCRLRDRLRYRSS